jgi:hypothetical protein
MNLLQARTSSPAQARSAANGEVENAALAPPEILDDPFSTPLPVRVPPAGGRW